MAEAVSNLPTEVELALEVMPCQAMRRSYDSNAKPHPCALDASTADRYDNLVLATERNIQLAMVAGRPRLGDETLMRDAGFDEASLEKLTIGGRKKALRPEHPSSPLNGLSLAAAATTLREEMSDLARAELRSLFMPLDARVEASIELDLQFEPDETEFSTAAAAPPLTSIALDPLTVIDDPAFFDALDAIEHLPAFLKGPKGLRKFYRRTTI